MAAVVVGAFLGAVVGFVIMYAVIRMAVSDAIRATVKPEFLLQEPEDDFELDAGDEVVDPR